MGNLDTHTIICVLRLAYGHSIPQRQAGRVEWAVCCDYAASKAAASLAALLSANETTLLSFNLVCPLITENSSRTRNPDLPITTSKPVHPHIRSFQSS